MTPLTEYTGRRTERRWESKNKLNFAAFLTTNNHQNTINQDWLDSSMNMCILSLQSLLKVYNDRRTKISSESDGTQQMEISVTQKTDSGQYACVATTPEGEVKTITDLHVSGS